MLKKYTQFKGTLVTWTFHKSSFELASLKTLTIQREYQPKGVPVDLVITQPKFQTNVLETLATQGCKDDLSASQVKLWINVLECTDHSMDATIDLNITQANVLKRMCSKHSQQGHVDDLNVPQNKLWIDILGNAHKPKGVTVDLVVTQLKS